MKRTYLAILPLLLSIETTAHAIEQVTMAYEPEANDASPANLPGSCPVSLERVLDQRNNKESVGTLYMPVLSGDPIPWVGAALGNLSAYGYRVVKEEKTPPGGITMTAALTRSYVFHGPMRINGMVALDAVFTLPSGEKVARKYRAAGSKINMANGTDEFMTTLNYAMNNLVDKLAHDLQGLCQRAEKISAFRAPFQWGIMTEYDATYGAPGRIKTTKFFDEERRIKGGRRDLNRV